MVVRSVWVAIALHSGELLPGSVQHFAKTEHCLHPRVWGRVEERLGFEIILLDLTSFLKAFLQDLNQLTMLSFSQRPLGSLIIGDEFNVTHERRVLQILQTIWAEVLHYQRGNLNNSQFVLPVMALPRITRPELGITHDFQVQELDCLLLHAIIDLQMRVAHGLLIELNCHILVDEIELEDEQLSLQSQSRWKRLLV